MKNKRTMTKIELTAILVLCVIAFITALMISCVYNEIRSISCNSLDCIEYNNQRPYMWLKLSVITAMPVITAIFGISKYIITNKKSENHKKGEKDYEIRN